MNPPQRHFLGFTRPFLDALCSWVMEQAGDPRFPDLSNLLIVVQGARTARGLEQRLALRADEAGVLLVPPRVTTPGNALSFLFHKPTSLATAGGFAGHAAWVAALEGLAAEQKAVLGIGRSGPFSSVQRDLASTLLGVDAELVAGCLEAGAVAEILRANPDAPERAACRWDVFDEVSRAAQNHLARWGLQDPSRRKAGLAAQGDCLPDLHLVLAGLPDFDPLFLRGFERLTGRKDVLIFAEEGPGFDAWGRVVPEDWVGKKLDLAGGSLVAPEDSLAQAGVIAGWVGRREGAIIDAPDEAEIPGLMDAMQARG
ncbi:MAG: hypothetical protein WEB60_09660, partial [Terrimicrobiaceae bacterium]